MIQSVHSGENMGGMEQIIILICVASVGIVLGFLPYWLFMCIEKLTGKWGWESTLLFWMMFFLITVNRWIGLGKAVDKSLFAELDSQFIATTIVLCFFFGKDILQKISERRKGLL